MSMTLETREVEVIHCDGCGEETKNAETCIVCHREFCGKGGGKTHFAFSLKIFRCGDRVRGYVRVCKECAEKPVRVLLEKTEVPEGLSLTSFIIRFLMDN